METQPSRSEHPPKLEVRGRALLDAWQRSGLSRAAFARQHQIGKHRLIYWTKRLRFLNGSASVHGRPSAPPDFVQIPISRPHSHSPLAHADRSHLEILLRCGAIVRVIPGVDSTLLRLVVAALDGASC